MQNALDLNFYRTLMAALELPADLQNRLEARLAQALDNPRSFYDDDGEFVLSQSGLIWQKDRGLTWKKDRSLTVKFVFVDSLIEAEQMAEVDWSENDVRFAIGVVLGAKQFDFELSLEEEYDFYDTFYDLREVNERELIPNGLSLEFLDINSDSYVFTIVPLEQQSTVAAMFAALK